MFLYLTPQSSTFAIITWFNDSTKNYFTIQHRVVSFWTGDNLFSMVICIWLTLYYQNWKVYYEVNKHLKHSQTMKSFGKPSTLGKYACSIRTCMYLFSQPCRISGKETNVVKFCKHEKFWLCSSVNNILFQQTSEENFMLMACEKKYSVFPVRPLCSGGWAFTKITQFSSSAGATWNDLALAQNYWQAGGYCIRQESDCLADFIVFSERNTQQNPVNYVVKIEMPKVLPR